MNFIDLIKNRYTTKNYNADKKIPNEKIEQLKEILNYSPSSINSQPWKFFFVKDPEVKAQLAEASFYNKNKILDSSDLIVFTVFNSPETFESQMASYLPDGAVQYYQANVKNLDSREIQSWMEHQVYIALGVLLSASASMEIDATPMEGIDKGKYNEILKLDKHHALFAVSLGYRTDDDFNQPSLSPKKRKALNEVVEVI